MRLFCLFMLFSGVFVQGQQAFIARVESSVEELGYTVVKTETVGAQKSTFELDYHFYPGNKYLISYTPLKQGSAPIHLVLFNADNLSQVIRSTEINNFTLNLIFEKAPVDGKLRLEGLKSLGDLNIGILTIAYKSGKTVVGESKSNLPENYYYSLSGMDALPAVRKSYKQQVEAKVKDLVAQDGYTLSLTKPLHVNSAKDSIIYTVYEGNDYLFYAYSEDYLPVKVELSRKNVLNALAGMFGDTKAEESQYDIFLSEGASLIWDFKAEGNAYEKIGLAIPNVPCLPSEEVHLIVAYKSKTNDTKNANNNVAEDTFYKENGEMDLDFWDY